MNGESESDKYIAELLAVAPPLSEEQRDELRVLAAPAVAAARSRRSELARAAALTRWARTVNRSQATRPARDAYLAKYLPDGYDTLSPVRQAKAMDCAVRAHAARMRAAKIAKRAAGG